MYTHVCHKLGFWTSVLELLLWCWWTRIIGSLVEKPDFDHGHSKRWRNGKCLTGIQWVSLSARTTHGGLNLMTSLSLRQGIDFAHHWKEIKPGTWPNSRKVVIAKQRINSKRKWVFYLKGRMWVFLNGDTRDGKQEKIKKERKMSRRREAGIPHVRVEWSGNNRDDTILVFRTLLITLFFLCLIPPIIWVLEIILDTLRADTYLKPFNLHFKQVTKQKFSTFPNYKTCPQKSLFAQFAPIPTLNNFHMCVPESSSPMKSELHFCYFFAPKNNSNKMESWPRKRASCWQS